MDSTEFMQDGNCTSGGQGALVSLFFPEVGHQADRGKEICRSCTVRQECLNYALRHRIKEGIWGGMNERERRKVLKQRGGAYVVRRRPQDLSKTEQES